MQRRERGKMYIPQKDIDVAMRVVDVKRKAASVRFPQAELENYKKILARIAKENRFHERLYVSETPYQAIKESYDNMLAGMVQEYATHSDDFKRNVDIAKYVTAANDYLSVLTLKELKCPLFPRDWESDNRNMMLGAIKGIVALKPREIISTKDTFNKQRHKNAAELESGRVGELIKKITQGKHSEDELGELFAEYKALSKRQQKHGPIWRKLHSNENAEREELLERMEETLSKHIGSDSLDEDIEPMHLVTERESLNVFRVISKNIMDSGLNSEKIFGYQAYRDNPERLAALEDSVRNVVDYNDRRDSSIQEQLSQSLLENDDIKVEKREAQLTKLNLEKSITN